MQIKDIMSQPAVTCPVTSTLDQVARLMWEFDCGIVPIVGDDGRLAGVVTDRDICMAAYTQGESLARIPVTTAMASQVLSVHSSEDVDQAEHLMAEGQVHRLPVLDDEQQLIGVVSMNDLARLAVRAHKHGVDREFVRTLAAVCQPRASTPLAQVTGPVASN